MKYKRTDLIPGPPKHWLYGTMHHTRKGSQNFKDHLVLTKKYGGMVRLVLTSYYFDSMMISLVRIRFHEKIVFILFLSFNMMLKTGIPENPPF